MTKIHQKAIIIIALPITDQENYLSGRDSLINLVSYSSEEKLPDNHGDILLVISVCSPC